MITVRLGTPADIEAAIGVWRLANEASRGKPISAEHEQRARRYIVTDDAFFVVAEEDHSVVGLALAMQARVDRGKGAPITSRCQLGLISVHPAYSGRGIARRVLMTLFAEAVARGYDGAQVSTRVDNGAARRLYESFGLRPTDLEMDDEIRGPSMQYALTPLVGHQTSSRPGNTRTRGAPPPNATQYRPMLLTDDQLAAFDRDGFLVVPRAMSDELCALLEKTSDEWIASGTNWNREHVPDSVGYRDCINRDQVFRQLLTLDTVFPGIVQILGTNIRLLGTQVIYVDPLPADAIAEDSPNVAPEWRHGARGAGWHQDLYSVTRDFDPRALPMLAIKVMYYLTDCLTPESGMTLFAKGSHRKDRTAIKANGVDREDLVIPSIRRGDAVMFENRAFHAGAANRSAQVRKSIGFQYGFRWLGSMYDIDYPEALLAECNDVERQLLGGTHDRAPDGSIGRNLATAPLRRWAEEVKIVPRGGGRSQSPRSAGKPSVAATM